MAVPVVVVLVMVVTDAVIRVRAARRVVLLVNLLLRSVVDSVVAVELLLLRFGVSNEGKRIRENR